MVVPRGSIRGFRFCVNEPPGGYVIMLKGVAMVESEWTVNDRNRDRGLRARQEWP